VGSAHDPANPERDYFTRNLFLGKKSKILHDADGKFK
jgi:hypothetical protein